jgi:hypothetical protein
LRRPRKRNDTAENTLCARYARGDYARLGRIDEIFAHWPAASGRRIRRDPGFDSVRADPRYEEFRAAATPTRTIK